MSTRKNFCLDCIDKFMLQIRARKNRSVAKSKKVKDVKNTRKLLGITEEVQMGLISSVPIDDSANGKLFYPDKHFAFVFSVEFLYQLLSLTQRLVRKGTLDPFRAPKAARDQQFGLYRSWGVGGYNDWEKSL